MEIDLVKEKQEILSKTCLKTKEWLLTAEGKAFKQQQRESFHSNKDKIIEGIRNPSGMSQYSKLKSFFNNVLHNSF